MKKRRSSGSRSKRPRPAPPSAETGVPRTVIVDGYNLILRSPAFRPDDRRDLESARDKLVNLLSWAVGQGEADFIVVFDGAETGGAIPRIQRSGRVTVRFSEPPQTADAVIREIVERLADSERALTVVSSDLEVAQHARAHGAMIVFSDLFAASLFPERVKAQVEEYKRAAAKEEAGGEKPLGFSKKDMAEWLRLFGEPPRDPDE